MKFGFILVLVVGVSVSEAAFKKGFLKDIFKGLSNSFRKIVESPATASQLFKSQQEINNEMRIHMKAMVDNDPSIFKDAVANTSQNEENAQVLLNMFSQVQKLLEDAQENVEKGILERSEKLQKRLKKNPQTERQDSDINKEQDEYPRIILKGIKKWVDDRIGGAPSFIYECMDFLEFDARQVLNHIDQYYEQLDNLQDKEIGSKLDKNSKKIRFSFDCAVKEVKRIKKFIAQNYASNSIGVKRSCNLNKF